MQTVGTHESYGHIDGYVMIECSHCGSLGDQRVPSVEAWKVSTMRLMPCNVN